MTKSGVVKNKPSHQHDLYVNRQFPRSGTYVGTYIDLPEPARVDSDWMNDPDAHRKWREDPSWYQWNQARMAARAVRHSVLLSSVTGIRSSRPPRIVEHGRVETASAEGTRTVDVYVDPPINLFRSVPSLGRKITEGTQKQYDSLGIEPKDQQLWQPLGRLAFRRTKELAWFGDEYLDRSKRFIQFVGGWAIQNRKKLVDRNARDLVKRKAGAILRKLTTKP